ncbi:hypothetical protein DMENIID0001_145500 [Sergentomyia squamirostris]
MLSGNYLCIQCGLSVCVLKRMFIVTPFNGEKNGHDLGPYDDDDSDHSSSDEGYGSLDENHRDRILPSKAEYDHFITLPDGSIHGLKPITLSPKEPQLIRIPLDFPCSCRNPLEPIWLYYPDPEHVLPPEIPFQCHPLYLALFVPVIINNWIWYRPSLMLDKLHFFNL